MPWYFELGTLGSGVDAESSSEPRGRLLFRNRRSAATAGHPGHERATAPGRDCRRWRAGASGRSRHRSWGCCWRSLRECRALYQRLHERTSAERDGPAEAPLFPQCMLIMPSVRGDASQAADARIHGRKHLGCRTTACTASPANDGELEPSHVLPSTLFAPQKTAQVEIKEPFWVLHRFARPAPDCD